jgi:hypothetical protein
MPIITELTYEFCKNRTIGAGAELLQCRPAAPDGSHEPHTAIIEIALGYAQTALLLFDITFREVASKVPNRHIRRPITGVS